MAPPRAKPPSKRPRAERRTAERAKPHERVKASARVLTLDDQWAVDLAERVIGDTHPFQREALLDPSRFKSLLVGRGGGKTTMIRADAIIALTSIRRGRLVYVAPTRGMAEELLWLPLKDSIEFYGLLEDFTFNESKLACTCKRTGAVLKLVGADDSAEVNKLRGRPFDRVYVDEAALFPAKLLEELLDRAIGPRLGERDGRIMMASTPGHILSGPFYDATRPGAVDPEGNPLHRPWRERDKPAFVDWDGWSSHYWTLKAVVELPDAEAHYPALVKLWAEALRVKKRKRWSDQNPIWLREYLGIWAADETGMVFRYVPFKDGGEPWNRWDPFDGQKLEGIQMLRASIAKLRAMGFTDLHFVIPGDMGTSDPFALNPLAFSPRDPLRRIWHVMAFERTAMYARPIAELLIGPEAVERVLRGDSMEPLGGVFGETGWPDGMVMDADAATIDELSKVYGLRFVKADRNAGYKAGAIELTNGDLVDARIQVLPDTQLESQLQQLQWREDINGRVKEDQRQANHSTDTLIYGRKMIAQLFESGAVEQEAKSPARGQAPAPLARDPPPGIAPEREFEGLLTDAGYVDIWGNSE